jgi:hypothetical protein
VPWMRKETTNENCLVVVENNDEAKQLISEVQRYHQDKKLETILDEKGRQHVPRLSCARRCRPRRLQQRADVEVAFSKTERRQGSSNGHVEFSSPVQRKMVPLSTSPSASLPIDGRRCLRTRLNRKAASPPQH